MNKFVETKSFFAASLFPALLFTFALCQSEARDTGDINSLPPPQVRTTDVISWDSINPELRDLLGNWQRQPTPDRFQETKRKQGGTIGGSGGGSGVTCREPVGSNTYTVFLDVAERYGNDHFRTSLWGNSFSLSIEYDDRKRLDSQPTAMTHSAEYLRQLLRDFIAPIHPRLASELKTSIDRVVAYPWIVQDQLPLLNDFSARSGSSIERLLKVGVCQTVQLVLQHQILGENSDYLVHVIQRNYYESINRWGKNSQSFVKIILHEAYNDLVRRLRRPGPASRTDIIRDRASYLLLPEVVSKFLPGSVTKSSLNTTFSASDWKPAHDPRCNRRIFARYFFESVLEENPEATILPTECLPSAQQ